MSSLTRLLPLIFIILANLFAAARGQTNCSISGNYTSGSAYQSNLNSLLSSLSRNLDENGFYNASVGENSDRAYALVLCRGDLQLDTCRSCIQNATVDLVQACPNQRQAIFWNELCMLRYSDVSMFRNLTISPAANIFIQRNASSPNQFNADRRILLENLWGQAANGSSLRKVAAMSRPSADFQTIYALMQCTPDLTSEECTTCLTGAAQQLPRCCESRTFARIVRPSCNLIYNIESFYNNSRLLELAQTSVAPTPGTGGNNTTQIIIITAVSVSVGVILIIIVGYLLRKCGKKKAYEESEMDGISKAESLQYEFDKLRAATNNFSEANKLGQGGFGSVYRGKLGDGQEIAVKRLSCDSCQGDLEFKNEVMLLAKLQHRNLVRLLGYCLERTEKILVYEFLQNASLDRFIFGPKRCSNLDWGTRYEIIWGIVKGLLYLHEDSRLRIIHRDLKASNILLDEDMNPKIADFGTARLFVPNETRANTSRIVGTFGYMAPEYAMHGQFSVKSDVFSFGVLVLEIISGQRNNRFHENGRDGEDLLTRAAWRNWQEETVSNLIDPTLKGSSGIPQDLMRCIHIGLLCVQQNAGDRPTMASVVQMLNSSYTSMLPVPSRPAYFVASDYDLDASLTHGYNSRDTDNTAISLGSYVHDYSI